MSQTNRGTRRSAERLHRVPLDGGGDRPRPVTFGIAGVLRKLMPPPSRAFELRELSQAERQTLYRMAATSPREQLRYERALARYLKAAV
jgi:hypothetical protein